MKNLLKLSALTLLLFCLFPQRNGNGEDNPLTPLSDQAVKYFKSASLTITDVKQASMTLTRESGSELAAGSRLDIFRPGEQFYHPVTKEPLGRFEKHIGTAEIKSMSDTTFEASIIDGTPQKDDIARITKSKIRALYYQTKKMDWFLGDAYFRQLRDTQRFELIDTPLADDEIGKLTEEAKRLQAEVLIVVDSVTEKDEKYLSQRIFWVKDGKELLAGKSKYTDAYVEKLASAADLFIASMSTPVITYTLPKSSEFITTGDVKGDGQVEILIGHGSDVTVYQPGVDLHKLWELHDSKLGENLYLDVFKTDTKGLVVISSLLRDGVHSYVYELRDNDFHEVWHTQGFLRVIKNSLYYQAYSHLSGFDGQVEKINYDGTFTITGQPLKLPKGVNLYDFAIIEDTEKNEQLTLYYSKDNYINLVDSNGVSTFRSKRNMGGFTKEYKNAQSILMVDGGNWYVSDKLTASGSRVTAIKRIPLTSTVRTLGYKESDLISYRYVGLTLEEDVLANVGGSILDYTIYKDKVYVLAKPFLGLKLSNILKGDNPLVSTLYVYSIIKY